MHKNKIILIISMSIAGVMSLLFGEVAPNPDSGKQRIVGIMSNQEGGIAAYNKKHIHYAEAQNLAQDLNVAEIAKFLGCKTLVGESFLVETISSPVSPQDRDTILRARQDAVRTLVENPELKKEVEQLLERAHAEEQAVITLFSDLFIGKTCPEMQQLELLKKQSPFFYPVVEFLNTNSALKTWQTANNALMFTSTLGIAAVLAKKINTAEQGVSCGQDVVWLLYTALCNGLLGYTIYDEYSKALEKRSKVHALNQFITIAERFEQLCVKYQIKSQFNMSEIQDPQGIALVRALKHPRYKGKNSWFFMTPLVHTFLYKMYQQDKHLSEVFACIAEIDTYNALATKIVESQNSKNRFCFVTFAEQEKSLVSTRGFWNVLVKEAVSSDLTESRHIILTGPNAGGKTTTIRALLQNIVLGQSYGVAAAETFTFTMFDIIHSYLNTSDDILNKLSLFASEVKRAQGILQIIKSLEPHKKYFFALDELFTGTVSEDGEKCAYEFIKRITEFQGVQFIYATHFNKLKELGNDNSVCVNYKVDAPIKNDAGKLVYPYTLSQGVNQSYVALDLAAEAGLFA